MKLATLCGTALAIVAMATIGYAVKNPIVGVQGNDIVLKDEKGAWSKITQANVFQSNGVIHVVDTVVLPN